MIIYLKLAINARGQYKKFVQMQWLRNQKNTDNALAFSLMLISTKFQMSFCLFARKVDVVKWENTWDEVRFYMKAYNLLKYVFFREYFSSIYSIYLDNVKMAASSYDLKWFLRSNLQTWLVLFEIAYFVWLVKQFNNQILWLSLHLAL